MRTHSFIVQYAVELGINSAILLNYFGHWHCKSIHIDSKNFDGYTWTYNSIKSLREVYPYLSDMKIRTAINNLIDRRLLIKGDYNKRRYDKTTWYALTKEGCQYLELPFVKITNGFVKTTNRSSENNEPIPISKPINKPINAQFEKFWGLYDKKKDKKKAEKAWSKLSNSDVNELFEVLPKYLKQFEMNNKFQPYPATFINRERWKDDVEEEQPLLINNIHYQVL